MNLSFAINAFRWLARDTFRQAWSSGLGWFMPAVSGLCILVCLSVDVTGGTPLHHGGEPAEFLPRNDPQAKAEVARKAGVNVIGGELSLAFGAFKAQLGRDSDDAVRFLQLILAGALADTAGILLALVWTAGFLPSFLEPGAAVVLLVKPLPRWGLLLGKFLGVLLFVAVQATLFTGGTWFALGVRTGYWEPSYLLCIPLMLLQFAVFFSFSVFLAVCTRSTILCVIGSLVFWFVCWGMNYGRHALVALPVLDSSAGEVPAVLRGMVESGYWLLPKPADFGMVLSDILQAGSYFGTVSAFEAVRKSGAFVPELSLLTSLASAVLMLGGAAGQLSATDY